MNSGPILLALAVLATAAGGAAVTALLRPQSRIDAALAFGVVAPAGCTAAMTIAGLPGFLRPSVVLSILCAWAILAALAVRPWALAWNGSGTHSPRPPVQLWPAALVLMAAAALAWQVLVALVLPPFAYDGLTYHLTTVISWVQRGSLDISPYSKCCAYYPLTPDLLFAVPALFLHDDSLVDLVQVPFVLLGAAATAGLARIVGISRGGAVAAAALFAVTPAVLTQAPTNYVDVIMSALVLTSLYSITRFAQTGRPQHILVAGLAAGLVLGTKGIGLLWAIALFIYAIIAAVLAVRDGRTTTSSVVRWLCLSAAAAFALGGWWYLRNVVTTGNPLYPFHLRMFGMTVFHGPLEVSNTLTVPSAGTRFGWPVTVVLSWASDLTFWRQGSYDYQQRIGGLGPLWAWLGIPCTAILLISLAKRRSIALLPIAAILIVFLIQPYGWWARFTIPLAALGSIATAYVATTTANSALRGAVRILACCLALSGVILSSRAVDPAARALELPASRVLALFRENQDKRTIGALIHPEYRFLEQVPANATIVVDPGAEPVRFMSPLFGPALSRRVLVKATPEELRSAWLVTAAGRGLDQAAASTHRLMWDARGIRVWEPAKPAAELSR